MTRHCYFQLGLQSLHHVRIIQKRPRDNHHSVSRSVRASVEISKRIRCHLSKRRCELAFLQIGVKIDIEHRTIIPFGRRALL